MSCSRPVSSECAPAPAHLGAAGALAEPHEALAVDGEAVTPSEGMVSTTTPRLADLGRRPDRARVGDVAYERRAQRESGEHEHLHPRVSLQQVAGAGHAVGTVELEIHDRHVGLELVGQLLRPIDVGRGAHAGQVAGRLMASASASANTG